MAHRSFAPGKGVLPVSKRVLLARKSVLLVSKSALLARKSVLLASRSVLLARKSVLLANKRAFFGGRQQTPGERLSLPPYMPEYSIPMQQNDPRNLKIILHALFLASGTATVLIGPLLPLLARQYSLNDLQVGFYFPAQFAGSLIGTLLTSAFARRNQFQSAAAVGAVMMFAGLLSMNIDSPELSLLAFFAMGIGIGLTLPAINMIILDLSPQNSAAALSVLNLCWGVGAIVCKPFVDLTSQSGSIRTTTIILALPMFASAVFLLFQPKRTEPITEKSDAEAESAVVPIWSTPIAWAVAVFNFIHVGFESGMGGWLPIYTERLDQTGSLHWLSPTLLFFTLFVVGRGVAPLLFRVFNENKMLLLGLFTVFGGMLVTVTAASVATLGIGAAVAGFGTSWLFPTNLSRFSKTFGPSATRRATPLFICGSLGATASTWMIGFVSNQTGSLLSGMYVLVVSIILLIVLQIVMIFRGKPQHQA